MPAVPGQLDEHGLPLIALELIGATRPLTAILDTGFEGEVLVYYDDLRNIGIDPRIDRLVQARLADGSEATLLGAALTVNWHGDARAVRADLVPALRPASALPLVGCRLLRDSRVEIDFPRASVLVSRA